MKKRLFQKILHELEGSLKDSIVIYLISPKDEWSKCLSKSMVQVSVNMLLSWLADQRKIIVGKENRIVDLDLTESNFVPDKTLEFEGEIVWEYKKQNLPTKLKQRCKINFNIENLNKRRTPYNIDFID